MAMAAGHPLLILIFGQIYVADVLLVEPLFGPQSFLSSRCGVFT